MSIHKTIFIRLLSSRFMHKVGDWRRVFHGARPTLPPIVQHAITMTIWTCHFSVAPKYILILMIKGFRGKALYQGMSQNYLKGHFQGQKGQLWSIFPQLLILYSSNKMLTNPVLKYERCGITLNVICKFKKVQFGDLFQLVSQKRCIIWPMFVSNTYTKSIYNLSVYIWPQMTDATWPFSLPY